MTIAVPQQADSDERLIGLWLHGKAASTKTAYTADVASFRAYAARPLRAIMLGDVQDWTDSLAPLKASSRARKTASVKSLFSFAHRIGFVAFNVAAVVRLPPVENVLSERILPEGDVHRMLALETHPRNRAMLNLLYGAGLRISEVCGLSWRNVQSRNDAGQVSVFGKGGKTRIVLLPVSVWRLLEGLRGDAVSDAAVFASRNGGGHLDPASVDRVVKAAAKRAGLSVKVSTHWLRHASASHALDRGCPISMVQAGLGHASIATTGRYLHAKPGDSHARYLGL